MRFGVFGTLSVAAMGAALVAGYRRPGWLAVLFGIGLLAWTIVEYLLHRLAFHGFAPHSEHHANPTDPVYIVAPLPLSLTSSAVLFGAFWLAAQWWAASAMIMAGVWAGYLAYEMVHLRIHSPAPGGALLRALRKHHYYHHFASDQVCYGVTTPLWDWVFGTVRTESHDS